MIISNAISPLKELLAYETLWARDNSSIKKISNTLKNTNLPSKANFSLMDLEVQNKIRDFIDKLQKNFSIITAQNYQYSKKLKDLEHQIKFLYYRGEKVNLIN